MQPQLETVIVTARMTDEIRQQSFGYYNLQEECKSFCKEHYLGMGYFRITGTGWCQLNSTKDGQDYRFTGMPKLAAMFKLRFG